MKRIELGNSIKSRLIISLLILATGIGNVTHASGEIEKVRDHSPKQKILFVASYNTKNPWSGRIKSGIQSVLRTRNNVELKVFDMDTMGVQSEDIKKEAALKAKKVIESYRPDIVITSDDNAAKYLILSYFYDSDLPFVFCGVNWDASEYGFPAKNVTGILEVQLIDQLVDYLAPYAKGNRIGSLRPDTMTNRNEAGHVERQLGTTIKTYFVSNIREWKKQFLQLQNEVDMILLGDIHSIDLEGESEAEVGQFMYENTIIPTGHWDPWFRKNALITVSPIPEEQGEYAAAAALEILDGKSPSDFPLAKNKKAKIFLNMKLAKKLGVIFPMDLVESALIVPAD